LVQRRAGRVDVHVDRAVHLEDVRDAIGVVPDGGRPRDHQLACVPGVPREERRIEAIPERTPIPLEHGDAVWDLVREARRERSRCSGSREWERRPPRRRRPSSRP
jgi:hypothetical protein